MKYEELKDSLIFFTIYKKEILFISCLSFK